MSSRKLLDDTPSQLDSDHILKLLIFQEWRSLCLAARIEYLEARNQRTEAKLEQLIRNVGDLVETYNQIKSEYYWATKEEVTERQEPTVRRVQIQRDYSGFHHELKRKKLKTKTWGGGGRE